MKRIRKLLTVTAAVLLLVTVFLLAAPLPLSWWLPRAGEENAALCCAVKVYDERPVTELSAEETQPLAEAIGQTRVRFRGWSDGPAFYPYVQVFLCDAESNMRLSDVKTLSFDGQGLLIADDLRFDLAGEDKTVFAEAFEQVCDTALAQKFKNS